MGKKILLADDSITIQKVIELTFSDEDFEVVTVGNGRLAMERLQDVRPDLVLCDIIMPEKDGYEVCEYVKRTPGLSHIPVLLLTGAFEPFDQERAARVGCDGFLAKPFEPQTLIAKVKDLLARASVGPAASAPAAAPVPARAPEPAPEPEAYAFEPEPPPSFPEPAPPPAMAFPEESGMSFFPEETFAEASEPPPPAARASDEAPSFPAAGDFEEYRSSTFDEVATPAPAAAPAAPGADPFRALDADEQSERLLPVTADEAATLHRAAAPEVAAPAPAAPEPPRPARAPLWTEQTMEVPLEVRARAAMEASLVDSEPLFEEVFDEPPAVRAPEPLATRVPAPAASASASPPEPPLPAPASPWPAAAAAAPPSADPATLSFSGPMPRLAAAVPAPAAPAPAGFSDGPEARRLPPVDADAQPAPPASGAAAVSVPVDMVAQIAQRVVAQISEKIIREIAWEVIPDLAEALIKKEIERLKAELQQT